MDKSLPTKTWKTMSLFSVTDLAVAGSCRCFDRSRYRYKNALMVPATQMQRLVSVSMNAV